MMPSLSLKDGLSCRPGADSARSAARRGAARFDSSGSVIGFIGFRVYCAVSKEIGGDIFKGLVKPDRASDDEVLL